MISQLNVNDNEISRLASFQSLKNTLRRLYAKRNKLRALDGLHLFRRLQVLDLEGNQIEEFPVLLNMDCLTSINLSNNRLSSLPNLSRVNSLDILNLEGNVIYSLENAMHSLSVRLKVLKLARNLINDLSQLHSLHCFAALHELSFDHNECVIGARFDYRPYAICCVPTLEILDGVKLDENVTLKENHKTQLKVGENPAIGEWIYSQGRGRSYRPGQHSQLVAYLETTCPSTHSTEMSRSTPTPLPESESIFGTAESVLMSESLSIGDEKLKKVLEKRRQHMAEVAAVDADASSARTISQVSSTSIFGHPSPAPSAVIKSPVPCQELSVISCSPDKENKSPARRKLDFDNDNANPEPSGDSDTAQQSVRTLTPVQQVLPVVSTSNNGNETANNPYYEYESRPAVASNRNHFLPAPSTVSDTSVTITSHSNVGRSHTYSTPKSGIVGRKPVNKRPLITSGSVKKTKQVGTRESAVKPARAVSVSLSNLTESATQTDESTLISNDPTKVAAAEKIQRWWKDVRHNTNDRSATVTRNTPRDSLNVDFATVTTRIERLELLVTEQRLELDKMTDVNSAAADIMHQLTNKLAHCEREYQWSCARHLNECETLRERMRAMETFMTELLPRPVNLTFELKGNDGGVLRWLVTGQENIVREYKFTIDGEDCGSIKRRPAYIDNLDTSQPHRFTVTAVTNGGYESSPGTLDYVPMIDSIKQAPIASLSKESQDSGDSAATYSIGVDETLQVSCIGSSVVEMYHLAVFQNWYEAKWVESLD